MADKLYTPEGRIAFVYLLEPRPAMATAQDQRAKYSCSIIFDPAAQATDAYKKLKAAAVAAAKAKFGDKTAELVKAGKLKTPFLDGNDQADYEGFKGNVFIRVTSLQKPGVVNRKREVITEPADLYSGCYGVATLSCFAYDKAGNKGVSFGLNNFQKTKEGVALSGRAPVDQDFQPLDDPEEGDGGTAGANKGSASRQVADEEIPF